VSGFGRPALIFGAACSLLTALAYRFGEIYLIPWLPWFRLATGWLLPRGLTSESVALATENGGRWISLRAVTAIPSRVGAATVPSGSTVSVLSQQSAALVYTVIVFSILAAWPARSLRTRVAMLMLGVPAVFVATSLDVPFTLAGLVRRIVFKAYAPEYVDRDVASLYASALENGGNIGLAIIAALLVVAVCRRTT
jgi:hypothetical protein